MVCSTWIRALAIFWVFATLSGVCCSIPLLGGGISSFAPLTSKSSLTMNPLSAKITSPGSISLVMCTSVALLPHTSPRIKPFGGIATRNFTVLWYLYSDQVCTWRRKCRNHSINTSVQSTVHLRFLYLCFSEFGKIWQNFLCMSQRWLKVSFIKMERWEI